MSATKLVLCPLSGAENAKRALPTAVHAATLTGAGLVLFSAVEDSHMVAARLRDLESVAQGLDVLGSIRAQVEAAPHAPARIGELAADPETTVVMATSTQPFIHQGYLGSAAERVVIDALAPVFLVGPHATLHLDQVQRIVVPCDGSVLSEQALLDAQVWRSYLDLDLWVVTCLDQHGDAGGSFAQAEANYVRRLAHEFDAQWEVLHGSDPGRAIAEWATDALVVMTSHGRSGLSRLALGSVTTTTVRWANGPVMVARER